MHSKNKLNLREPLSCLLQIMYTLSQAGQPNLKIKFHEFS